MKMEKIMKGLETIGLVLDVVCGMAAAKTLGSMAINARKNKVEAVATEEKKGKRNK